MVIESSQTRTGVVDLPPGLAQAKLQNDSTRTKKATEAPFRALAKDIATPCDISREHRDGVKLRAPLHPPAFAFDNRDVTVDR
jgi:hypothetical protein